MAETATSGVISIISQRIAECHPRPAYFGHPETNEWPEQLLASLVSNSVLAQAPEATSVICPGCEMQCLEPIVKRTKPGVVAPIAMIACQSRSDMGMVPVATDALGRWRCDFLSIAKWLAKQLAGDGVAIQISETELTLGKIRGKHGWQAVSMVVDDGDVNLLIDRTVLPLRTVVVLRNGVLAIDLPQQSISSGAAVPTNDADDTRLCFALDHQSRTVLADDVGKFGTPADYELVTVLVDARRDDIDKGRRSENFTWVSTRDIAVAINGESNTVDKRAQALRRRISKNAPHLEGLLESERWSGHRLHPRATILNTDQIRSEQQRSGL